MHISYLETLVNAYRAKVVADEAFNKIHSTVMLLEGVRGGDWYYDGLMVEIPSLNTSYPHIHFRKLNLPSGANPDPQPPTTKL